MQHTLKFSIEAAGSLSKFVLAEGFSFFDEFAEYVRSLPYGRVAPNTDGLAVLHQKVGTCSSKHQLLARVAHECGHPEVLLTVGIYEMSEKNTPGVGSVLRAASLNNIPEAHCYLKVGDTRLDFTGLSAGTTSPFEVLISEHTVPPVELTQAKSKLHQEAISTWAKTTGFSAAYAWSIREACIASLAAQSKK